jgi:hypothetical protein
VTTVRTLTVPAGSAVGVFAGLGIASAAGTSYEVMIYAPSESGLMLGDSGYATDPEVTIPMQFPFRVSSAQPAALPADDIFLVNNGPTAVTAVVSAWRR